MTQTEALRLALEFLEALSNNHWNDRQQAITAIKAALANEALERKAENARELGLDYEPQRTWVGLTDDEVYKIAFALEGEHWRKIADAIEAKLKDKNT